MSTLTIPVAPNSATASEIQQTFDLQRAYAPELALTSARDRKRKIQKILDYTMNNLDKLSEAMHKDFRKPKAEVIIGEIFAVKTEAKYAIKELSGWLKPKKVSMPLTLIGTSSYIRHEPKGNVLIISPWNYPFNLAIAPLISAIAAGNACIVKPSEMAPNTSAFIRQMIADLFEPKEVTVFEGDYTVAQELLALPFNHIFFTGSPAVGKIVMRAAAEHLTSVTLELGGKSPVVVDETANVKDAAEKIVWGKYLNNGQTCIAPDYAVVHHSIKDKFIKAYQEVVNKMYYSDGDIEQSDSYCRIVNRRHFDRIKGLMDDAIENGAKVEMGGKTNAEDNFIEPTLLTDVTTDMRVMKEEIFGPVLPVMTYVDKSEVVELITSMEKPLAMYVASKNKANIDYFLDRTSSGDVVINDTLIHFGHPHLGFGGVNNSGIGKSGGYHGFKEFSHERSVVNQVYGTMKPIYPPFTDKVNAVIKFMLRLV